MELVLFMGLSFGLILGWVWLDQANILIRSTQDTPTETKEVTYTVTVVSEEPKESEEDKLRRENRRLVSENHYLTRELMEAKGDIIGPYR